MSVVSGREQQEQVESLLRLCRHRSKFTPACRRRPDPDRRHTALSPTCACLSASRQAHTRAEHHWRSPEPLPIPGSSPCTRPPRVTSQSNVRRHPTHVHHQSTKRLAAPPLPRRGPIPPPNTSPAAAPPMPRPPRCPPSSSSARAASRDASTRTAPRCSAASAPCPRVRASRGAAPASWACCRRTRATDPCTSLGTRGATTMTR